MEPKRYIRSKYCAVCGKTNNLVFHFPNHEATLSGWERYQQWLKYIRDCGVDSPLVAYTKRKFLCSLHFKDDQFCTKKKLQLLRTAVPSLDAFSQNDICNNQAKNKDTAGMESEKQAATPESISEERKKAFLKKLGVVVPRKCNANKTGNRNGRERVTQTTAPGLPVKSGQVNNDPKQAPKDANRVEARTPSNIGSDKTCGNPQSGQLSNELNQTPKDANRVEALSLPNIGLGSTRDNPQPEAAEKEKRIGSESPPDLEIYTEAVEECSDVPVAASVSCPDDVSKKTHKAFDGFKTKPHVVKVLGNQNFKDPTVIKSVLEKVNLRKKGSVYVLPLKKFKDKPNKPLTKNLLERVVQNLPAVDIRLKSKLLSLLRGRPAKLPSIKKKNISKRKQKENIQPVSNDINVSNNKKNEKTKNLKECTCTLHCNKYIRKKPVIKVSPVAYAKMDGQSLKGDSQLPFSDDSVFDVENIFTVSTILTNINDKSQIEQLCQLLIESLFKLKNVNSDGIMSKLVVYLSQGNGDSYSALVETGSVTEKLPAAEVSRTGCNDTDISKTLEYSSPDNPPLETVVEATDNPCQLGTPQERVSDKNITENNLAFNTHIQEETNLVQNESKRKHVRIHLNVFHDHSYLSHDSQVLFDKPPYLLKLINIDTYKSSRINRPKIIKSPPKKLPKKIQKEMTKLRRYVTRLKEFLKKKNEHMQKMKDKIKYLGSALCQEKGLKRIRYPRENKNSEVELNEKTESNKILSENNKVLGESNKVLSGNNKELSRRKKLLCKSNKALSGSNKVKVVENISISEVGNNVNKKRRRKRRKTTIILTPDFVPPPLSDSSPNKEFQEQPVITEMTFDDRLEQFYHSFIEECANNCLR